MNAKILLIAFSAAAFTSCSTAYKSGQTPDDVYYSPARVVDERKDNDRKQDEAKPDENTADNNRIRMTIRDRRWREFNDDYDYSYNNSPYYYCTCSCNNYGYYYNPYYYVRPLYYPRVIPAAPVNSTPRMVNLNSYKNYNTAISSNPKLGTSNAQTSAGRYNNSNNSGSKFGNIIRQVLTPSSSPNNSTNNSSTNNSTRTYTPSTNSSSGSSGSSSGGSSSGTSVSRPGRG